MGNDMQVKSSFNSTHSVSSVTSSADGTAGESAVQTQNGETTIAIQTGSPGADDDDGMVASLGGEAIAVGDDTAAIGTIEGQINDTGTATIAEGSASFTASGESSGGDPAYASATTHGAVSSADTIVTVTSRSSETLQTNEGSEWTETSTIDLLAVDFNLSNASPASASTGEQTGAGSDQQSDTLEIDEPIPLDDFASGDLDGNFALIVVDVTAHGDDTLALVEVSALTVEDELSVISGYALFGIG
jgi:hypothetical protein